MKSLIALIPGHDKTPDELADAMLEQMRAKGIIPADTPQKAENASRSNDAHFS